MAIDDKGQQDPDRPDLSSFDVHPSVLFRLGAELVTDPTQALFELVKNAYDADATSVEVDVDTRAVSEDDPDLIGKLVVADNGTGMNRSELKNGWLTVSASPKSEMKERGETTPRLHRTPLGDKGLGRLGTQRLGHRVSIYTYADNSPEKRRSKKPVPGVSVSIDWRRFERVTRLGDVNFEIRNEVPEPPGTRLAIEGLASSDIWRGTARAQFHAELSKFVSPVRPPRRFALNILLDDVPVELASIDEVVQSASQSRWDVSFDGEELTVEGTVAQSFVRPQSKAKLQDWEVLVRGDDGQQLYQQMTEGARAVELGLDSPSRPGDLATFRFSMFLTELDSASLPGGLPVSPGSFDATFEHFGLDRVTMAELDAEMPSIFGEAASYRKVIRGLVGVHIYRDGFGVRTEHDWLGLGSAFTGATGFYALRPSNTLGLVNISAEKNQALKETTDREGFVHNPAYLTFRALLREVVAYISNCQNLVGRSYNELIKSERRSAAGVENDEPLRSVSQRVSGALREIDTLRPRIESARSAITGLPAEKSSQVDPVLTQVEELVSSLDAARSRAEVVESEVAELNDRLDDMIEMVAIGITAEALSHEITNAVNRLDSAARSLRKLARRKSVEPGSLPPLAQSLQASVRSLRRQVSHLDPTLRYARDVRKNFEVAGAVRDDFEYHNERWKDRSLRAELVVDDDFEVRMSPGRLIQVLDNLALNGEHWLLDSIAKGELAEGLLIAVVDAPLLVVHDNGPGVHESVEDSLFEPFVTRKSPGTGRGLGLFVIRELLDAEGCSVSLGPERNKFGRRYRFEIDLTNAMA